MLEMNHLQAVSDDTLLSINDAVVPREKFVDDLIDKI
jgi:hypothetical protein